MTAETTSLDALRTSAQRLRGIVEPLDDEAIMQAAYPTEWTIAQVMSHLGSGAVILQRRLHDELAGTTTSDEFAPRIWDEWNATTPRAQVDDGLTADAAFLAALDALGDDERDRFRFEMGPISVDFDGFVGLRLNEHALHTWDIDVALDDRGHDPHPDRGTRRRSPRARRPLHRQAHGRRPGDDRRSNHRPRPVLHRRAHSRGRRARTGGGSHDGRD